MADVSATSLSALPAMVSGIRLYQIGEQKFSIFRHYSPGVRRMKRLFDFQQNFFLNEVELFLILAFQDRELAARMVNDCRHQGWRSSILDDRVRDALGRNCNSFTDLLDEVGEGTRALRDEFRCFEPLEEAHQRRALQAIPLSESMLELRKLVNVTFEPKTFEMCISSLERSNTDLTHLRKQVELLQNRDTHSDIDVDGNSSGRARPRATALVRLPPAIAAFGAIRRASEALHEALATALSPSADSKPTHSVRLLLDSNSAHGHVQMGITLACNESQAVGSPPDRTQPLALDVRSFLSINAAIAERQASIPGAPKSKPDVPETLTPPEDGPCYKKRRRTPLQQATYNTLPLPTPSPLRPTLPSKETTSGHFCVELQRQMQDTAGYRLDTCLCRLENGTNKSWQDPHRHQFYRNPRLDQILGQRRQQQPGTIKLEDALDMPIDRRLTVPDQLRLARQLASGVLMFGLTPWMHSAHNHALLRQLEFFKQPEMNKGADTGTDQCDLALSLQTLHIRTDFPSSDTVSEAEATETRHINAEVAKYRHGVRNMTLYSLGVAMLAIGRWERIEMGDIEKVRRMVTQPCILGDRYRRVISRVIDCDFGQGNEFRDPRLRQEVYKGVVAELEAMLDEHLVLHSAT